MNQDKVTIRKDSLLAAIKNNRTQHVRELHDANLGYRDQMLSKLRWFAAQVEANKDIEIRDLLQILKPFDHTSDYDRVIKMLEMSTGDEATLSEDQFEKYVMDEWHWKQQHVAMSSSYRK